MFYDTHLQGDYNNGGVNAPPWSIRVNVEDSTDPVGPLSDPYRPRTDFNALVHDYEDKDTIIGAANAPFPRPVLVESFDEVFNTPLTYNYNLTFEREITTGWMARAGLRRIHGDSRTVEPLAEPGDLYARRSRRQSAGAPAASGIQRHQSASCRTERASITRCSSR